MALPQILPTNAKTWTNRHDTFTQPVNNLFDLINGDPSFDGYNAMTVAIQALLGRAIAENKTVRALGGGWSFSKVAATDGWILNTKMLNMVFPIRSTSVSPNYTGSFTQLLFSQCGTSIQELNNYLKKNKRSLKTSGASNGQTIVGCFSTGTHGSAIDVGSVPDFVVGLHIITGPDSHVWLERKSYPVAGDAIIQRLKTKLVADDDLFNAALVSFGSFGFIHGVMIETEDIYLLECYRRKIPIDDSFKHIMGTLDFSQPNSMPNGNERPFHFQAVVDEYNIAGGAYATIMYKRPFTDDHQPPVINDLNKAGPGDDVAGLIGIITDILPGLTHLLVSKLVKSSYPLFEKLSGTSGEIFTNNNIRGKLLSTAMGIPLDRVLEVNDMLISLNKTAGPFTGIFSYRYVKKSAATLAFTKFDFTCILELDGAVSNITRNFYDAVWNELDARNIPYTFHWGKINNLNPARTKKMYGAAMDKWIEQRNKIMTPTAMKIFNTQSLKDCGLDTILPAVLRPF